MASRSSTCDTLRILELLSPFAPLLQAYGHHLSLARVPEGLGTTRLRDGPMRRFPPRSPGHLRRQFALSLSPPPSGTSIPSIQLANVTKVATNKALLPSYRLMTMDGRQLQHDVCSTWSSVLSNR
ncbi:hypothetical protein V2G26_020336 [Clonostachys chloroleuca]